MRLCRAKCIRLLLLLLAAIICFCYLGSNWRRKDSNKQSYRQEDESVTSAISKMLLNPVLASGSVCHTPQCIAAFEAAAASRSNRIPPVRHILWKTDRVSSYFAKQLKTWHAIHPTWKYVLWRDSDLDKFVAKHYAGVVSKFRSLPKNIMRIDMIRYMILHHFGGVYADLDYVLVRPLDRFLKFPAVVTRETEAHSILHFGMSWPLPVLGNPAFMMSEPGHPFFHFCVLQLAARSADSIPNFAGPDGLSQLLKNYDKDFPVSENPDGVVFVPASRNFYAFEGNSFVSSTSEYKDGIVKILRGLCKGLTKQVSVPANLTAYCRDVNTLDPITDPNELVYAVHDSNKSRSSYDTRGSSAFYLNQVDIRSALPNIVMADTIYSTR